MYFDVVVMCKYTLIWGFCCISCALIIEYHVLPCGLLLRMYGTERSFYLYISLDSFTYL